jgi:hypothetical protein
MKLDMFITTTTWLALSTVAMIPGIVEGKGSLVDFDGEFEGLDVRRRVSATTTETETETETDAEPITASTDKHGIGIDRASPRRKLSKKKKKGRPDNCSRDYFYSKNDEIDNEQIFSVADPVFGTKQCADVNHCYGGKICSGDNIVVSPVQIYLDPDFKVEVGFITELDTIIDGKINALTTGSVVIKNGGELVYGGASLNEDKSTFLGGIGEFLGVIGTIDFRCLQDCKTNVIRVVEIRCAN